ncbi:MAG: polysaccharide deacetylase family protein, partial [Hyphomicrobium sp.]
MTARAKWRCTCILGLVLVVGGALAPAAWTATAAQAPHAPSPEVEPVAVDDAAQPNGAAAPHAPTVHAQGTHAQGSHFEDQQTQDRQAGSGTAANSEAGALPPIDACAAKPDVLGLSRVVEVDTANGPVFGGSHKGNNFLADGEVILTFDDGPMRAYTRQVLKALADHCTKATFFMVGRMAVADPAMVKEVAAAGHTVASHTWSHQNLKALGVAKGTKEFELGASAVSAALGTPSAPFFRFPYLNEGKHVADHLKERNTASFFIDVDSKDYLTRDPKKMHDKIMGQLMAQRKGIILMHDIQPSTAHG